MNIVSVQELQLDVTPEVVLPTTTSCVPGKTTVHFKWIRKSSVKLTEIMLIRRSVYDFIIVVPTCGKARHSCYNFCKVYVSACLSECIRPDLFRA